MLDKLEGRCKLRFKCFFRETPTGVCLEMNSVLFKITVEGGDQCTVKVPNY